MPWSNAALTLPFVPRSGAPVWTPPLDSNSSRISESEARTIFLDLWGADAPPAGPGGTLKTGQLFGRAVEGDFLLVLWTHGDIAPRRLPSRSFTDSRHIDLSPGGQSDESTHPLGPSLLDRSLLDRSLWTGACWTGACWTGACWTGALLDGACWTGACWTGACWTGACWTGACWTEPVGPEPVGPGLLAGEAGGGGCSSSAVLRNNSSAPKARAASHGTSPPSRDSGIRPHRWTWGISQDRLAGHRCLGESDRLVDEGLKHLSPMHLSPGRELPRMEVRLSSIVARIPRPEAGVQSLLHLLDRVQRRPCPEREVLASRGITQPLAAVSALTVRSPATAGSRSGCSCRSLGRPSARLSICSRATSLTSMISAAARSMFDGRSRVSRPSTAPRHRRTRATVESAVVDREIHGVGVEAQPTDRALGSKSTSRTLAPPRPARPEVDRRSSSCRRHPSGSPWR